MTTDQEDFLKTAATRVGTVGALLEIGHDRLFRVESYTWDEAGVRIRVTYVPTPGFWPSSKVSAEISSIWDLLSTDATRWQMRYGWKFLFGDAALESAITVGAIVADRGELLEDNQVLRIFRWHERRKEQNLEGPDLPGLLTFLFSPPMPSAIPPGTGSA